MNTTNLCARRRNSSEASSMNSSNLLNDALVHSKRFESPKVSYRDSKYFKIPKARSIDMLLGSIKPSRFASDCG